VSFVVNGLIKGEIEKQVSVPWFDCDESLTWRGLNSNLGYFIVLPLSLFHLENHVCLSRGVQVAGVVWRATTRIMAGVGDLMQRTDDGHTNRLLGVRSAPCTSRRGAQVSWLSLKIKVDGLSVV
jgi:hypothetical protein